MLAEFKKNLVITLYNIS